MSHFSELAIALAHKAKKTGAGQVKQIMPESGQLSHFLLSSHFMLIVGNMAQVLPEYLRDWTTNKVRSEGVDVINNRRVVAADMQGP